MTEDWLRTLTGGGGSAKRKKKKAPESSQGGVGEGRLTSGEELNDIQESSPKTARGAKEDGSRPKF